MKIGPNSLYIPSPTFTKISDSEGDNTPENLDKSSLEYGETGSESLNESVVLDKGDLMFPSFAVEADQFHQD